MTDLERLLDDEMTDAVMSGRTTPETAKWWKLQPYSGEKAKEWWERRQEKWLDPFSTGEQDAGNGR